MLMNAAIESTSVAAAQRRFKTASIGSNAKTGKR